MSRKPRPAVPKTDVPKPDVRDAALKYAALKYADEAVETLVGLMRNSGSDPVRIAAARELMDRACGKPRTEAAGGEGQRLEDMVRASYEREDP